MSGIAGIVNKDESPVDPRLLQRWLDFLRFRGPDGGQIWSEGPVGLVNTLLDTTGAAFPVHQPCSLDGKVWISADARIDGQQELKAKLQKVVAADPAHATDAKLILYAYHKWDLNCLDHLIGDFSFAIWDDAKQRLFCARDHFGVKPLFYADTSRHFMFSNTLNCLRLHPEVSNDLDDRAIADFLVYGMLVHLDRSAFSDIKRLPPAHCLSWSAEKGLDVRRYWSLPLPDLLRYPHRQDYIEQFRELMQQAVDDRLRTDCVLISMSGGLDSTSVAAVACNSEAHRYGHLSVQAGTSFHGRLIRDEEHRYARLAAERLGIPFHSLQVDAVSKDPWIGNWFKTPEPVGRMAPLGAYQQTKTLLKDFRVVFTGQGGDPAFYPAPSSFPFFMKKLLWGDLGLCIFRYKFERGRLPRLDIRKCFRRWIGKGAKPDTPVVPPWLNQRFCAQLEKDSFSIESIRLTKRTESLRGGAHQQLIHPMWPDFFENADSGVTRQPIDVRHPYFDLRVVGFLLSLPPVPWCVDKYLIRRAMKHRLPQAVLERAKTTPQGFSDYERVRKDETLFLNGQNLSGRLKRYIDLTRYRPMIEEPEKLLPVESELITRPIFLGHWLTMLDS